MRYGRNWNRVTSEQNAEVDRLVEMFKGMGFKRSAQVSRYIRSHRLGHLFPNIAGYLELDRDGCDRWEFEGGIKPQFYAMVCRRLELDNQRSNAQVVGFESYRDRQLRFAM